MITVLLLLSVLLVTIVVATVRVVALDGYRPVPTRSASTGLELPPTTTLNSRLG